MPAGTLLFSRPTFLMCAPRFFDVQYVINPWMEGNLGSASRSRAAAQWQALHAAISRHADVLLVDPQPGLPDMVFTANAGLVHQGRAALSRFRCPERQGEERHFRDWFAQAGLRPLEIPVAFEGEGDALFTPDGARLWAGYGWRTELASHALLRELWGVEVVSLRLTDPSFYHLDTCFTPLSNGDLLFYPPAFDSVSIALIEAFYPQANRIPVEREDALQFACNAINIGHALVLNQISPQLCARLQSRGFDVVQVPLGEFLKAGGAANCLTLRLSDLPAPVL